MLPWFLCGYIPPIVLALGFGDFPSEVLMAPNSVSNAGYVVEASFTARAYCHHETQCYPEYAECWVEPDSFGPSSIQTPLLCSTTVSCRDLGLPPEACCHAG